MLSRLGVSTGKYKLIHCSIVLNKFKFKGGLHNRIFSVLQNQSAKSLVALALRTTSTTNAHNQLTKTDETSITPAPRLVSQIIRTINVFLHQFVYNLKNFIS